MSLVGSWVIDGSDERAFRALGDVVLEFSDNGVLTYIIREDNKQQVMYLSYEIDGDSIITDQPSALRKERTSFTFLKDGKLLLGFGGEPYTFRRHPANLE